MFLSAMDLRSSRVAVGGLEADAELTDLGFVLLLVALRSAANAPYVFLVGKFVVIVFEDEPRGFQDKRDLGSTGVLGVLKEFVDEVGLVRVETPKGTRVAGALAALLYVVTEDSFVVSWNSIYRSITMIPLAIPTAMMSARKIARSMS